MTGSAGIHGTALALAVDPDGPLVGVLLRGAAGAGKTRTALHLIETCPFGRTALVADDHVNITHEPDGLIARAPAALAGLAEVRGAGPVAIRQTTAIRLAISIVLDDAERIAPKRTFKPLPDAPEGLAEFHIHGANGLRTLIAAFLAGQTPRCIVD